MAALQGRKQDSCFSVGLGISLPTPEPLRLSLVFLSHPSLTPKIQPGSQAFVKATINPGHGLCLPTGCAGS